MTQAATLQSDVRQVLDELVSRYVKTNPRSRQLFERGRASLPGGNTRTSVYVDPFPPYIERGEGVYLFDADGHRLVDFVNNSTALILGHAHPAVVEALQEQTARGTAFSRPTPLEIELAEVLQERVPSLEKLRFCSSGTETVMQALRAAMAFTGRSKIAKFEGAFHGAGEHALISHRPTGDTGPAHRPRSVPTAGLSPSISAEVVVLPFNDVEACAQIVAENAADLAAIIVDPLSTGAGFTLPADGFLASLRELAEEAGALLIFDEIISFRAARGGAQELYGMRPDLTCLGKVIVGGTAAGAFGGRADVMALYDPTADAAPIFHPGTYNGNPLSMVAGLATFRQLTPQVYERLEEQTRRLGAELQEIFAAAGVEAQLTTVGSLFRIHFMAKKPHNYRESLHNDDLMTRWLFFSLLERGIHWTDQGNVSVPMEEEHIDGLLSAVKDALENLLRP